MYFRIKKPNATDVAFTLEVGHCECGAFVADETYKNLDMNGNSDNFAVNKVNGASKLVQLKLGAKADPAAAGNAHVNDATLTSAAMPADNNHFSNLFKDGMTMTLNLNALGPKKIVLGTTDVTLAGTSNGDDGQVLAGAIETAVKTVGPQDSYANFTCGYAADQTFVLTSGLKASYSSVVVYDGDGNDTDLAHAPGLDSASNPTVVTGASNVVPVAMMGSSDQGVPLAGGTGGLPGSTECKNFFSTKLKRVPDVSIIVLPGQSMPASGGNAVIDEALSHAEDTRSRMVIIDPAKDLTLDQAVKVTQMGLPTSTYAVLYYPWIKITNPLYSESTASTESQALTIAPSAFAAGIWSKTDGRRGVWKAPAGVETALFGVAGLQVNVGEADQDQLNPLGVNCVRNLPGYGSVIWGSRTLATKADPEWRYVPIRRTAIMIEQSIYKGICAPTSAHLWMGSFAPARSTATNPRTSISSAADWATP